MRGQGERYGLLIPPQLKDNGAFAGLTYIDTKPIGFEANEIDLLLATGTTDIATTAVPKVQECDTTDGTYTDVTSAALAAAIAATDDDTISKITVNLSGIHKRYMKVLVTAGDGTVGQNFCIIGVLKRLEKGALSASDANLTERVVV